MNAQEEEIAKTNFPVRLTPEEEAEEQGSPSCNSCCSPVDANACQPTCCRRPSLNCPPVIPRCDPCDCIIDYYNPLVYNGWDLSCELLIWTVQQKASTFVLSPHGIHQPFPPSTISDSIGKYHSASFNWAPGVRASISYTFERDAWNLMGQYTYYGTSGRDTVHRPDEPTLYLEPTTREVSLSDRGVNEMTSHTSFSYNVFDFLLSRRFLPGCQILFDFFAGPTAALISENWKIRGTDIAGPTPNAETKSRSKWQFSGGGMRAGLNANWHMGAGFGLYNQFSFATLVGSYSYNKKVRVNATPTPFIDSLLKPYVGRTTEEEIWVVPATQLEFGINWNHRFCHWAISIQGAFEINTWYDLHQYHQEAASFSGPTHDKLDYRNTSPVNLWGFNFSTNFSF